MKKIFSILITFTMCLCIVGCNNSSYDKNTALITQEKLDIIDAKITTSQNNLWLTIKFDNNPNEKHSFFFELNNYYLYEIYPDITENKYLNTYIYPNIEINNTNYENSLSDKEISNIDYSFSDNTIYSADRKLTNSEVKPIKYRLKKHNKLLKRLDLTPTDLINWTKWYNVKGYDVIINAVFELIIALIIPLFLLFIHCKIRKYSFPTLLQILVRTAIIIALTILSYPSLNPLWFSIPIFYILPIYKLRKRVTNAPIKNNRSRMKDILKIRRLISNDMFEIRTRVINAKSKKMSTIRKKVAHYQSKKTFSIKKIIMEFALQNSSIMLNSAATEDLYKLLMKTPQLRVVLEKYNSNHIELYELFYRLFFSLNKYTDSENYLAVDAFCFQKSLIYIYKHKDEIGTNKSISKNIFKYFNLTKEEENNPDIVFSIFDIKNELEMIAAKLIPLNIEDDTIIRPIDVGLNFDIQKSTIKILWIPIIIFFLFYVSGDVITLLNKDKPNKIFSMAPKEVVKNYNTVFGYNSVLDDQYSPRLKDKYPKPEKIKFDKIKSDKNYIYYFYTAKDKNEQIIIKTSKPGEIHSLSYTLTLERPFKKKDFDRINASKYQSTFISISDSPGPYDRKIYHVDSLKKGESVSNRDDGALFTHSYNKIKKDKTNKKSYYQYELTVEKP